MTTPITRPTRDETVDAGFLLALCTAVLLGLAPTYTGSGFVVVGFAGVLVGLVLVHVTSRLRWPLVAPVLLAVAAFFLLGGALCLRADGAVAPTPHTLGLLADQLLFGWKDLLTTLPPVDGDGPLLVLPWALGLAAGTGGALLARVRSGPVWLRAPLPLLAPLLLLAAVILLGVRAPSSLWTQGAAVAALGMTWLVLRAHRAGGPVVGGSGRSTRIVSGAVLLGAAAVAAQPVGTWAVGGDEADVSRVVLRTYVEPPFDVGQYPSPLASLPPVRRDAAARRRQPLRPGAVHHRGRAGRDAGPDRHPGRLRRRGLGRRPTTPSRAAPTTPSSGSARRSTTRPRAVRSTSG